MHYLFLLFFIVIGNIFGFKDEETSLVEVRKIDPFEELVKDISIAKKQHAIDLIEQATPKILGGSKFDLEKKKFVFKAPYISSDPLAQYLLKEICEHDNDYQKLLLAYGSNLTENNIQKNFYEALEKCNSQDFNLIQQGLAVIASLAQKRFPLAIYKLALLMFKFNKSELCLELLNSPELSKYPPAMFLKAYIYYSKDDFKNAFKFASFAEEDAKYVPAIYLKSRLHLLAGNIDRAKEKLKYCVAKGFELARNDLAVLLDRTGTEVEKKESIKLLKDLAKQNDPYACYNLANSFEAGDGVKQDDDQAVEYYYKALKSDIDVEAKEKIYGILNEFVQKDNDLAKVCLIEYNFRQGRDLNYKTNIDWITDIWEKYAGKKKNVQLGKKKLKVLAKLKEINITGILTEYNTIESRFLLAYVNFYGLSDICEINLKKTEELLDEVCSNNLLEMNFVPAYELLALVHLSKVETTSNESLQISYFKKAMELFRQAYLVGIDSQVPFYKKTAEQSLNHVKTISTLMSDGCTIEHFYAKANLLSLLLVSPRIENDFEKRIKLMCRELHDIGYFIKNCSKNNFPVYVKYLESLGLFNLLNKFADDRCKIGGEYTEIIQRFYEHLAIFFENVNNIDVSMKHQQTALTAGSNLPKLLRAKSLLEADIEDPAGMDTVRKIIFELLTEVLDSKTDLRSRAEAAYLMSNFYNEGWLDKFDQKKAAEYLKFAAENGVKNAKLEHAELRIFMSETKEEAEEHLKTIHQHADDQTLPNSKRAPVCLSLAHIYSSRDGNMDEVPNFVIKPDFEKAKKYCLLSIKLGHGKANYLLGILYAEECFPKEKNRNGKAEECFKKAVNAGEKRALLDLANVTLIAKRHEEAYDLYQKAYEHLKDVKRRGRNKFPEIRMALFHLRGYGKIKADVCPAIEWVIKGIENGAITNGEYRDDMLPLLLPFQKYIPKKVILDADIQEAFKKLKKTLTLAGIGNFELGNLYLVQNKFSEAYETYKESYEELKDKERQTDKFPETRIAIMHAKGLGPVKKDFVQAMVWTIKAIENGAVKDNKLNDGMLAVVLHEIFNNNTYEGNSEKSSPLFSVFLKKLQDMLLKSGMSVQYLNLKNSENKKPTNQQYVLIDNTKLEAVEKLLSANGL